MHLYPTMSSMPSRDEVNLLLDTHVLLWALASPRRLPLRASAAIRDPANRVFFSAASTWEIAIKASLGKLVADVRDVARAASGADFDELPITVAHSLRVRDLPPHHRDPFDRILVAQAWEEGLTVVTRDPALQAYSVPILFD